MTDDDSDRWIDVTQVGDKYRREFNPYRDRERGGDRPRWEGNLPLSWNGVSEHRRNLD